MVDTKTQLGRIYKQRGLRGTCCSELIVGCFVIAATWQAQVDSCPTAFLIAEYTGSLQTRPP